MKNSEYWKQRFVQLERSQTANSAKATKEVQDIYRSAQAEIENQIFSWYGRFAKNNGITMAEARQLLKANELEEFHWSVEEYIKRGKECAVNNQKWFKELENASAKFHITRLEALETNLKANFEILAAQKDGLVSEAVKGAYKTGYYKSCFEVQRGFNVGFDIGQIDEDKLEKLIRKPWAADGYNFSERIWRDKNKLLNLAHQEITKSAMLGSSPDKAIKAIAQAMGTSKYNAQRLVMTESSYFHALGEKKMYTEFGYEKYEVIASHSAVRKTCELCAEMDGKIFLTRDFEPGLNANPFHPNCHCTTVPYFDDFNEGEERFARGEDGKGYYVPSDMKYNEWKERFVEGGEKEVSTVVPTVEEPADLRSRFDELKKQYSDAENVAEKLKEEHKKLEAKVYFGDGGTDEEMKRLRKINDEMKSAEKRAEDIKIKMLDTQKEYADAAGKRLVDDGIFEQVKLPKSITPDAVDEIEGKLRELYSDYGIMPKKMIYNPMKSGGNLASYSWNEGTLYLGNDVLDKERYAERLQRGIDVFNTNQKKLRKLYENQLSEAEKILSDKSVKGYERYKAQLQKDQALVQLNQVRIIVPENVAEVIEHEYGHFLHDTANRMSGIYNPKKYIGMKQLHGELQLWDSNNKSGQVAASTISQYAAKNPEEAIAEAFVAKRKGYAVPEVFDNILEDIDKIVGKPIDKAAKSGIMKLSSKFVNPNEPLYKNADKIKPLEGYGDIVIHGTPDSLLIYGLNGEQWEYTAKEAAEMIRNSREFHGQPMRLISCQTGAKENGIAQQIADELGVEILAPTEIVNIDIDGEMFISDNEVLVEIWNASSEEERKHITQTGHWETFKPNKR